MMNICSEALERSPPEASPANVVLVSAAALIDTDGRILFAQRPEGKSMAGLWEFPGGKVKENETPEFALMRELKEELGIETRPCCFTPAGFASHSYEDFHLLMPLFACRQWKGLVTAQEGQELKWLFLDEAYDLPMPDADIPLISQLKSLL